MSYDHALIALGIWLGTGLLTLWCVQTYYRYYIPDRSEWLAVRTKAILRCLALGPIGGCLFILAEGPHHIVRVKE